MTMIRATHHFVETVKSKTALSLTITHSSISIYERPRCFSRIWCLVTSWLCLAQRQGTNPIHFWILQGCVDGGNRKPRQDHGERILLSTEGLVPRRRAKKLEPGGQVWIILLWWSSGCEPWYWRRINSCLASWNSQGIMLGATKKMASDSLDSDWFLWRDRGSTRLGSCYFATLEFDVTTGVHDVHFGESN